MIFVPKGTYILVRKAEGLKKPFHLINMYWAPIMCQTVLGSGDISMTKADIISTAYILLVRGKQ